MVYDWTSVWSYETATPASMEAPRSFSVQIQPYFDNGILRRELQNSRSYVFIVRLTNFMGQQALLMSNGIINFCLSYLKF